MEKKVVLSPFRRTPHHPKREEGNPLNKGGCKQYYAKVINHTKRPLRSAAFLSPPLEGAGCHLFFLEWCSFLCSCLGLERLSPASFVSGAAVPISLQVFLFFSCGWCQICFLNRSL